MRVPKANQLTMVLAAAAVGLFARPGSPIAAGEPLFEQTDSRAVEKLVRTKPWQADGACGANCLFVYLRLHGVDIRHDDVVKALPAKERGISLHELKELAWRLGVSSQVVWATPANLDAINVPAIAHLRADTAEHFVLICDMGNDGVLKVLDGSSGDYQEVQRSRFEQQWTGYLLVRERANRRLREIVETTIVCLLLATAYGLVRKLPLTYR